MAEESSLASPEQEMNPIPSSSRGRQQKKPPSRPLMLLLTILIIIAIGLSIKSAWQRTWLKEAYLPELEAKAISEPENGTLQVIMAARLAQANDYVRASVHFEKAITAGEAAPDVWLAWSASKAAANLREEAGAILQMGLKNPDAAPKLRAAIERVRPLSPEATPEQLAEAISPSGVAPLIQTYAPGSYFDAYREWQGKRSPEQSGFATREKWANTKPNDVEAQRLWGEALMRNRRYGEAEIALRKALEIDSTSLSLLLAHADAQRLRGDYGKAGLEYVAILKRKKDWLPALMGLGQVALEKRLLVIGTDVYESAVKQSPDNVEAWIGLGRAHYNRRLNLGRALEAFQKAAQLDPKRTDFYNFYSNALRANFKFSEAESITRQRLAADPNDAQAHFLLALLLLDHNSSPERRTEAIAALETSRKLVPNVSATETRLAQLLVEDNKTQEAIPILENVIRRDLINLTAYQTLARAYRKAGLKNEAEQVQASANELSAYLQRTSFLEDLIQRQPSNLKAHKELADLYERGNEPEKAARQKEMVAVLQKDPKRATQGIRNLNQATALGTPEDVKR